MNRSLLLNLAFSLYIFAFSSTVCAQVYPPNFSQVEVASGISNPTAMACAPDGRIFVAEQDGTLHVIKNGVKLSTPALQLPVDSRGERGLIGLVLHPQFSTNKVIYLYYTLPDGSHNRVSRFWVKNDVIDPAREQIILELSPLSSATNHNGGAMQFYNDKLFIATGDNANGANATDMETFHGKIIRINSNGSVPGDTPDYWGSYVKRRLWASGLRNAFTLAIQPGTGRVFVNDVGQDSWEEINDATAPALNFGWPTYEGPAGNGSVTRPIFAYQHGSGDGKGCAISGGTFFNPPITEYPALYDGKYFYQDLCNNWINYLDLSSPTPVRNSFATGLPGGSLGLSVAADGNLYFLSRSAGKLYKIVYNNTSAPVITDQPDALTLNQHKTATFSVEASGALPLIFQWKKNGANIPGATSRIFTITDVSPDDGGDYTVTVANQFGSVSSQSATLQVNPNQPPTAHITEGVYPDQGFFRYGELFYYYGQVSDPEDGNIYSDTGRRYWTTRFYIDGEIAMEWQSEGTDLWIRPEDLGFKNTSDAFYRLILTGTDSGGLSASDSVDVFPFKSTVTLVTNPPGLDILLEGVRTQTPITMERIEGQQFSLDVITPQAIDNSVYEFSSWGNGGAGAQILAIPSDDSTVVANFEPAIEGWVAIDLGEPDIAGYTQINDGTFNVNSSGYDIWGTADEFHYVYQAVNGDVDIRVRVDEMTNTRHSWAKAGLMIRETLDVNSKHASIVLTPSQGTNFFRRTQTGGSTMNTSVAGSTQRWLRLVRSGNTFTSYRSADGAAWEQVVSQSFTMNSNAHVGLVLTSRSAPTLSSATFTNVTLTGSVSAASFAQAETLRDVEEISVYPNPVSDKFFVELREELKYPSKIRLLNALGQVLSEHQVSGENNAPLEFSVGNMANGMYIIQLDRLDRTTRKIIMKE